MLVRDIDRKLDMRLVLRVRQNTEFFSAIADIRTKLPVFIFCSNSDHCAVKIQEFSLKRFIQGNGRAIKGFAPFAIGCEDIIDLFHKEGDDSRFLQLL